MVNKPESMSTKEYLFKKVSSGLQVPVTIVRAVITDQFASAQEALKDNNSIEISGFGKFVLTHKKCLNTMAKYERQMIAFDKWLADPEITDVKRRNTEMKKETIRNNMEHLKHKINGFNEV